MSININSPEVGAASAELQHRAHTLWVDEAARHGIPVEQLSLNADLNDRVAWARRNGMEIGTIYTRFSTKMQQSTDDQLRECIVWSARNKVYVPPELICLDEAASGKISRRNGLQRAKRILNTNLAHILIVYKISRLFRQAFKGFQFIQEEVVDEGLRAVSVSQGIDTADAKSWRLQTQMHGIMDEAFLGNIADHVRSGLIGVHEKGWTTGAIGVGYRRKELLNAPRTKRGLPRTVPEIDPAAADLIRQHAQWLLSGMSLRHGWRRWVAAGGPWDPRSSEGRMSLNAYRRLWTNIRLIGRWEYGRRRNRFMSRRDYVMQIEQPDAEVSVFQCEELRILDDATFFALRDQLLKRKRGSRGLRAEKKNKLWDLTTGCFYCAHCSQEGKPERFYQCGANGEGMQCRNSDLCQTKSAVRRKEAVQKICKRLSELITNDSQLVEEIILRSVEVSAEGNSDLEKEMEQQSTVVSRLFRQIDDLTDIAGAGSDEDRQQIKVKIRSALAERAAASRQLQTLRDALTNPSRTTTADNIREVIADMSTILQSAAAGDLGDDAVYKAFSIFSALTGGHIKVTVERRAQRKRSNMRATFTPSLLQAVQTAMKIPCRNTVHGAKVSVWLREPPRLDQIADRVHDLIANDGLALSEVVTILKGEGVCVGVENVRNAYWRWYDMRGLPTPKMAYNNGRKRKPRSR